MTMSMKAHQPTKLDLDLKLQVLTITWGDGVTSQLPAALLRRSCPCAACRTERDQQARADLPILKSIPENAGRCIGGNVVGNYALKLDWADGHNTGIYDFRLLRSLHDLHSGGL